MIINCEDILITNYGKKVFAYCIIPAIVVVILGVYLFITTVPGQIKQGIYCDDVCLKQNHVSSKTWMHHDIVYCVCDLTTNVVRLDIE